MSTINVNLMKCHHSKGMADDPVHKHSCLEQPIPIPCPIPRSVTFTVRLGECDCMVNDERLARGFHAGDCAGRPIRVSCSIGGDGTWAGSEPFDFDDGGATLTDAQLEAAEDACRDRWALVRALVLGHMRGGALTPPIGPEALFIQRDAVFSALADMARHEDRIFAAQVALDKAVSAQEFSDVRGVSSDPADRSSTDFLVAYVARLIEQVGILEGGQ